VPACVPAPAILQDQFANGGADLQPFGCEQLHVEPFLLLGCKDLPIDVGSYMRFLGGVIEWLR
jgi:hypothetical protein